MIKKGRWEDWEKDYLFKHNADMTAQELADHLGRTKNAIIEMRRKLSIKKNKNQIKPEDINKMLATQQDIRESTSVQDLDDAQQRRFWYNQLHSSPIWQECLLMFEEEELELYKQKYVEFMMTLETVNEVEKGTIHIMISSLIRVNRYQKLEKEYRDMAKGGDAEAGAKAISLHREMKDMVEIYLKAQDDLNASRKQRIKEEGDQRMNLLELIKELDQKEAREKLGREADALQHIKNLESNRLHNGTFIRGD